MDDMYRKQIEDRLLPDGCGEDGRQGLAPAPQLERERKTLSITLLASFQRAEFGSHRWAAQLLPRKAAHAFLLKGGFDPSAGRTRKLAERMTGAFVLVDKDTLANLSLQCRRTL